MIQELSGTNFDAYFNDNPKQQRTTSLYNKDNNQPATTLAHGTTNNHSQRPVFSPMSPNDRHCNYSTHLLNGHRQEQFSFGWNHQNSTSHIPSLESAVSFSEHTSQDIFSKSNPEYNIRDAANRALNNFFAKNKKSLHKSDQELSNIHLPMTHIKEPSPRDSRGEIPSPPLMVAISSINQSHHFKSKRKNTLICFLLFSLLVHYFC